MSKIRWSNVDGVQVSKLFFGNMYYFEYLADVSEIYFDSFRAKLHNYANNYN